MEHLSRRPEVSLNINVVVITGNLTRDPELRSTPGGTAVCKLRVASNSRRKVGDEWVDKPNYFDVTVWGNQGGNAARFLSQGRPVAIEGRLDWREWQDKDDNKRQSVEIIADSVQYLGGKDSGEETTSATDSQDEDRQPVGATAGGGEDDIPF
jgi:single-strand DNA-binding protein